MVKENKITNLDKEVNRIYLSLKQDIEGKLIDEKLVIRLIGDIMLLVEMDYSSSCGMFKKNLVKGVINTIIKNEIPNTENGKILKKALLLFVDKNFDSIVETSIKLVKKGFKQLKKRCKGKCFICS